MVSRDLWLHVLSDAGIALAYFAIPVSLLALAWRRRELPFPWLFVMFAAFITACGITHVMGIWTVWRPDYGVEGLVKAGTALVWLATAAILIPVLPKALALRSPAELKSVNIRLADEVDRHRATSAALARTHGELEARVEARTAELAASEARYRALVEAMAAVVWTTGPDGVVDDMPGWRELTGATAEAVRGWGWLDTIHPDEREGVRAAWAEAIATCSPYDVEYRVRTRDGAWRWFNARGVPVRGEDGRVREWVGVCIDIDERHRAEQSLRESEERYRALVETSPDAVYAHSEGTIILANQEAPACSGPRHRRRWSAAPPSRSWTRRASRRRARVARLVEPGMRNELAEFTFRRLDGRTITVEAASAAVMMSGRLAVQVAFRDVSARKAAEQHQRLLLQELSHRVKNTLAVVQSIAARSLADDRPPAEARQAFTRRLQALANAHTLLTASDWQGASLKALVEAELAPYSRRAEVKGDEITLTPKETLTLSLVLHELATNAAKHGALSVPEGRIAVDWRLSGEGMLHLVWRESGGPAVSPPERQGFGRVLVERAVAYDLRGQARLDFAPTGVRYELEAELGLAAA